MIKRKILLNPGPATTTDTVKQAQIVPDICPREKEFGDLMESVSKDLVRIVARETKYEAVLFGGSGTAGIEAIVSSVVPHGKKLLVLVNGAYGERMMKIAQAYGIPSIKNCVDWGSETDLSALEKELEADSDIATVGMVHHETTTGILNSVEEVGRLVKKYNRVFIVDAVSSFAGVPLNAENAGIDFLASTSNKCIQGMPGITFVIAKKEGLEKIREFPKRNFYLSLYEQYRYFKEKHQMRFTAPVQTLYALRQAIDEFFEEGGIEARYKRYKENWQVLVNGMKNLGFRRFKPEVPQSHILTTFYEPENPNYDFERMHDLLYEKGFTIYPGKIKEKTFRLANMGAINSEDIKSFLDAMNQVLEEMSLKLK